MTFLSLAKIVIIFTTIIKNNMIVLILFEFYFIFLKNYNYPRKIYMQIFIYAL